MRPMPPMRRAFVQALPLLLALVLALAAAMPAQAADPKPEIARQPAQPQALNAVHTLRQIPEACARLEGMFTGDATDPYAFAVVRISPECQPRARFVDAAKAQPSQASGWKLNDLIRVPSAACPSLQAVVHVWRKPQASAQPPKLDAQGRSRLYLEEQMKAAKSQPVALPMYAATMAVEGSCR